MMFGNITNNSGQIIGSENGMLEPLLGSATCEQALLFILARQEGYARQISTFFGLKLYAVQRQLEKLEAGGVLVSRLAGRTRLYEFNPRYAFLKELQTLLAKALDFYPADERARILMNRRRPRRQGKPL
jgi:predicted ArsR family transcriptional regulator